MNEQSTITGIRRGTAAAAFSLIELLIGIAVIGILASIAVPSYIGYMQQNRRADAITILTQAAGEQQRFFSDYNRYANSMTQLGFGEQATVDSEAGYYTVSVVNASPTEFELRAAPVPGGPQANDTDCATLTLNDRGVTGTTGTQDAADCW